MSNSKPEPPPQCAKPARLFKTDNAEGMGEEDEEVAMINMLRGAADLDEGSLKAPSPVDAESDGPRAPQSPAVKRAKAKINRSKSPSASQRRVEWHEAESEARRATQSDEDVHAAAAESMDRSDSKMNDARVRCMLEEVIDELATLSADADGSKGSLKPRTYFNITHDTGGAEIRSTEPPQPQPQPQPQTQPPRCASPAVQVRPGRDKKREKALSRHRKSSRSGSSQTSIVGSHRATNVPGQSPLEAPIFKINGIIREEYIKVKDNKWKKRWLILDESHLYLFKSHEDLGSPVIINLMGGAVKRRRAGESGKCDPVFDVITTGQTYSFEAETEAECMEWVIAVTQVCEQLVLCEIGGGAPRKAGVARSTSPVNDEGGDDAQAGAGSAEIERLVKEDGNSVCADCGAPDPEWASVNIGAFLCIGCSGFHRSFGTHVSKVRSIRLDKWEEDHVSVLRTMGNIKANEIWEYDIGDAERITPGASNDARGRWLRAKYVEKRFTKEFVEAAKVAMPFTRATLKTMLLSLLAEDEEFRSEIRKLLDKE